MLSLHCSPSLSPVPFCLSFVNIFISLGSACPCPFSAFLTLWCPFSLANSLSVSYWAVVYFLSFLFCFLSSFLSSASSLSSTFSPCLSIFLSFYADFFQYFSQSVFFLSCLLVSLNTSLTLSAFLFLFLYLFQISPPFTILLFPPVFLAHFILPPLCLHWLNSICLWCVCVCVSALPHHAISPFPE